MFTTTVNERIVQLASVLASLQCLLKGNCKQRQRITLQCDILLLEQQLEHYQAMKYKQLDYV